MLTTCSVFLFELLKCLVPFLISLTTSLCLGVRSCDILILLKPSYDVFKSVTRAITCFLFNREKNLVLNLTISYIEA